MPTDFSDKEVFPWVEAVNNVRDMILCDNLPPAISGDSADELLDKILFEKCPANCAALCVRAFILEEEQTRKQNGDADVSDTALRVLAEIRARYEFSIFSTKTGDPHGDHAEAAYFGYTASVFDLAELRKSIESVFRPWIGTLAKRAMRAYTYSIQEGRGYVAPPLVVPS